MFTKILVALDRSDLNKLVFDEALDLAKTNNAKIMLLHVLSSEEENSPTLPIYSSLSYYPQLSNYDLYQKKWDEFKAKGLEFLKFYEKIATSEGIETEFTQQIGSPSRAICQFAKNWGSDLIVIGRRGHSALQEFFLGSTSNYVLHHSPCSVLTIEKSLEKTVDSQEFDSSELELNSV
ncbi:MAG: universal stress protein [Mastigocoleus sp.]